MFSQNSLCHRDLVHFVRAVVNTCGSFHSVEERNDRIVAHPETTVHLKAAVNHLLEGVRYEKLDE